MRNLRLTVSYDGTDFGGWQTQPGRRTVQEVLEKALGQLAGTRIRCNASGRTDAGVHAAAQVVNFFTTMSIPAERLPLALASLLPSDVVVREAAEAPLAFDANKDATRKLYRYVIYDGRIPDVFLRRYACHSRQRLDVALMQRASRCLVGRHDFHSFETEWPNRLSSIRTITHLDVSRVGQSIRIDVEADGFLYNMVRTIAGTLMNVGRGFWPEEKVAAILQAEDRREAGPTAPPQGLFLIRVSYDRSLVGVQASSSAAEIPQNLFLCERDEERH